MKAICVDDEPLITDYVASLCRELPQLDEVTGFTSAGEAVRWMETHDMDLALLDIDMPEMSGIVLAAVIKKLHPETAIVFLTGFSEFAVKAFELHVSGYLLKPVSRERLAAEVEHALRGNRKKPGAHILARTFGTFELLVDGEPVTFYQEKGKELMAFLIDRQGVDVTRGEAFAALWEDRAYDRRMQKQFDVTIRRLRDSLKACGIGDVLENRKGTLRIRPEEIWCDAWRFFSGDPDAVNAYRGEYMIGYAWGSDTESYMNRKTGGRVSPRKEDG